MATPIEDQIYQHVVALEAEKAKAEGRKPRKVQKPWTRKDQEQTLCPSDLLQVVREHDYRLDDEGFQAYCRSRGTLHAAGVEGSRRREFMAEHSKTKDEYAADTYFQFAEECDGTRYKYTTREMEIGWGIIELGRAVLQDCWELYQAQRH